MPTSVTRLHHSTSRSIRTRVVALRGEYKSDVIAQSDLDELANLQRMHWAAAKSAALKSEEIKARLRQGATLESGRLNYDPHLEMVMNWVGTDAHPTRTRVERDTEEVRGILEALADRVSALSE